MVHGACKSVGCFAMTDKGIERDLRLCRRGLSAGQREVPVHIFPFRMTDAAIARGDQRRRLNAFSPLTAMARNGPVLWHNLKEGYDLFQQTGEPPTAYACGDRYAFGALDASCATGRRLVKAGCANRTPRFARFLTRLGLSQYSTEFPTRRRPSRWSKPWTPPSP